MYIVGLSQYVIIQLLYYSNPLIMLLDYHPRISIYKAISGNIVCQKILTKMGIYLKIPYSIYCRKIHSCIIMMIMMMIVSVDGLGGTYYIYSMYIYVITI